MRHSDLKRLLASPRGAVRDSSAKLMGASTVWYHGGPPVHDWAHIRWDRERGTADPNAVGPGMYWTTDPVQARGYAHDHADPTVYSATKRAGFVEFPRKRPALAEIRALYELADPEAQGIFLSNWDVDRDVATRTEVDRALLPYVRNSGPLFDAYVTLYHDLFAYDANAYVKALRRLGYDGYVVKMREGVRHLVLWNPEAMKVEEVASGMARSGNRRRSRPSRRSRRR